MFASGAASAQEGAASSDGEKTQQQIEKLFQQQSQRQAEQRLRYTGSLVGHIVCSDTQRAARSADVQLVPVTAVMKTVTGDLEWGSSVPNATSGLTDLEGNFEIDHVAPGEYYVAAALSGYLLVAEQITEGVHAGGDLKKLLAAVPQVRVGDGAASVSLTLQRGGTVAGVVQWDDGSPAANIQMDAVPVTEPALETPPAGSSSLTQPNEVKRRGSATCCGR